MKIAYSSNDTRSIKDLESFFGKAVDVTTTDGTTIIGKLFKPVDEDYPAWRKGDDIIFVKFSDDQRISDHYIKVSAIKQIVGQR